MRKRLFIFILFFIAAVPAIAAKTKTTDRFINKSLYQNIYPSTLNNNVQNAGTNAQTGKTNTKTQAGTTTSSNKRVVKRPTRARGATNAQPTTSRRVVPRMTPTTRTNVARAGTSATMVARPSNTNTNNDRRVVSRNVSINRARAGSLGRTKTTKDTTVTIQNSMSSQECFANYKACMDNYCERKDAAYNRCYCSAKLAQIDSRYQNKIDSLVQQIIKLKYNVNATDEEIKSYWDETVGTYTETNPWVNIDNALNIDWASTESRVRGQNAFATGHSYCVGYLRSCSYMALNLRDAYKSEIERDCATYEQGLSRIQTAAESVIESYNQ